MVHARTNARTQSKATRIVAALLTGLALLLAMLTVPATPAQAHVGDPAYGRLRHPDGHLKSGCKRYYFHYRLKQAGNEWTFEIFWVDRRGRRVADNILLSGHACISNSGGVAFAHNLVVGRIEIHNDEREVPYFRPHSTELVALRQKCAAGDAHAARWRGARSGRQDAGHRP